jgi:type VI secretion system protein ImpL
MATFTRRVAEETTLMPPKAPAPPSPLAAAAKKADKALEEAARLADPGAAPAVVGGGPLERMVDDHFAGYRRLVTGQPSPMDELRKLFDEQQTYLLAIDNAQKTKSPPPPGGGAGPKLKLAGRPAARQPEGDDGTLADAGAKQSQTAERDVLTRRAQAHCRLLPACHGQPLPLRRRIARRRAARRLRPAVRPGRHAGRVLQQAPGGHGRHRHRHLGPTSRCPTAARPPAGSLPDFQRASRIREAFFRSGGKAPSFRIDVRAAELADGLKEVTIDIDGQAFKLTAGGQPVTISWPSQRVASRVTLSTSPAGTPQVFDGPWGLFRLFERYEIVASGQPERFGVNMTIDGKRARLEVTSSSVLNPFRMREMQQFRCPAGV